jgi:signal transduction histidine kinase
VIAAIPADALSIVSFDNARDQHTTLIERGSESLLSLVRDHSSNDDSAAEDVLGNGVPLVLDVGDLTYGSYMAVPLVVDDNPVGVMRIISKKANLYDSQHIEFAAKLSRKISGTIALAARNKALAKSEMVQHSLSELAVDLARSDSAPAMYKSIDRVLSRFLVYDRISVDIANGYRKTVTLAYQRGLTVPDVNTGDVFQVAESFDGFALWSNELTDSAEGVEHLQVEDSPGAYNALGLESSVRAPMTTETGFVGAISLRSLKKYSFSKADQEFVKRVALQAAPALEKSRLLEQLNSQTQELESGLKQSKLLAQMSHAISENLDIDQIFKSLADELMSAIPYDRVAIVNRADKRGIVFERGVTVEGLGVGLAQEKPLVFEPHGSIVEEITADSSHPADRLVFKAGLRTRLRGRIGTHAQQLGSMAVLSKKEKAYSEADAELLDRICALLAPALLNSDKHTETLRLADELSQHEAQLKNLSDELILASNIVRLITSERDAAQLATSLTPLFSDAISHTSWEVRTINREQGTTDLLMGYRRPEESDDYKKPLPLADSILEYVANSRHGFLYPGDDKSALLEQFPATKADPDIGFIGVPLIEADGVMGVLIFTRRGERKFEESDRTIAQTLGNQIASAVASRLLLNKVEVQSQREQLVAQIGREISSADTISKLGEILAAGIHSAISFDTFFLTEIDGTNRNQSTHYAEHRDENAKPTALPTASGTADSLNDNLFDLFDENKESKLYKFSSHEEALQTFPNISRNSGMKVSSILSSPLVDHGKLVGSIQIRSQEQNAFSSANITVFEAVASQAAGVFAAALLRERTQRSLVERNLLANLGTAANQASSLRELSHALTTEIRGVLEPDLLVAVSGDLIGKQLDTWTIWSNSHPLAWPTGSVAESDTITQKFLKMQATEEFLISLLNLRADAGPIDKQILEQLGSIGIETVVVSPLRSGDENNGFILLGFAKGALLRESVRSTMDEIANLISSTVDNLLLRDQLAQRVEDRTAELKIANQELEAFTYTVSHDLRGPIRTSQAFSKIVLEEFKDDLPPEAVKYIELSRSSSIHLGQLVEDLLQFSRVGGGTIEKLNVDIKSIVSKIVGTYRYDDSVHAEIEIGELPRAAGDPALIERVFSNLIDNAIKFSAGTENAKIEIFAENEKGVPVYRVRDYGVGFDTQYAEKIFGVFERLHSSTSFEGTGVGLAIVDKIVTRHGGSVWFESNVGEGTTFSFTLEGEN